MKGDAKCDDEECEVELLFQFQNGQQGETFMSVLRPIFSLLLIVLILLSTVSIGALDAKLNGDSGISVMGAILGFCAGLLGAGYGLLISSIDARLERQFKMLEWNFQRQAEAHAKIIETLEKRPTAD